MTGSVERLLQRKMLKLNTWAKSPKVRKSTQGILWGAGGLVLSAARLWDQPVPLAAAAVAALPLPLKSTAALGAALGYGVFFGVNGGLPSVWAAGILLLTASASIAQSPLLPWIAGGFVALSNLTFQVCGLCRTDFPVFAMQVGGIMGGIALFSYCWERRKTWPALGALAVFALGCIHRGLGLLAAGAAGSTLPVWAFLLWAGAAEAAAPGPIPISIMAGLTVLSRSLPLHKSWQRCIAPGLGAAGAMVLFRFFDPVLALCGTAGGLLGVALPALHVGLQRRGTGAAQVRLEQMARLLGRLQNSLLEQPLPQIDEGAFVDKIRINACGCCSARDICTQEQDISAGLLHGDLSFRCRKTGRVLRELQATQAQINQLKLNHSRQGEYRIALVQQYGYLSSFLELLADDLAGNLPEPKPSYRIQISARSRKKETANGDRCMAFAGNACRFYILLCDGMGTGMAAAGEAEHTASLLRGMLQVGLPPQYALGAINAQLALRQMAGAVTIDLAEIRLDNGRAAIYKWGAAPSWLLRRGKPQQVGAPSPPPGLNLEGTGHTVSRLNLSRGDMLILISDGVCFPEKVMAGAFSCSPEPAQMAEKLLEYLPEGSDDATAAAIKLSPCGKAG